MATMILEVATAILYLWEIRQLILMVTELLTELILTATVDQISVTLAAQPP